MKMIFVFVLCCTQSLCLFSLDKWFIAFKKNSGDPLSHLELYTPLFPPEGKFYADPMLFKYKGINYIFFEDYDYKKGVISCVTVDKELYISEPIKIIELETHLSFPYVFMDNHHIYMIPESGNAKEIALYEAMQFPEKWEKQRVLLPIKGADNILFQHEGYYWLFTSTYPKYNLLIFYADNLFSEFHAHPINNLNLIGRNAGAVFNNKGRLIRPVMDSTDGYGHHIVLKEIVKLSPYDFEEKEVGLITPDWAPRLKGTHTFNFNEDLIVYDGKMINEPFPIIETSSKILKD